ncbi:MAG: hypothetical protein ACU0CO_05990 [Shimia sp.]
MRGFLLATGLIAAPTIGLAQDVTDLSADQLTNLAIEVTETGDGDRLVEVMREMRSRGMHFFATAAGPLCEQEAPRLEVFESHWAHWGRVNESFGLFARLVAVQQETCACPRSVVTFDQFTEAVVGKAPEEIGRDDVIPLRRFAQDAGRDARAIYADFYGTACRED